MCSSTVRCTTGSRPSDVTSLGARHNSIAAGVRRHRRARACCSTSRGCAASSGSSPATRSHPTSSTPRARRNGSHVEPGDILLVSTGRDARRAEHGPWDPNRVGLAGLDPECVPWLHDARSRGARLRRCLRRAARRTRTSGRCPFTSACWSGWACTCSTTCSSAGSPAACARERRWEFLFVVLPLQIGGGTGSPVNPVAVL